MLHALAKGGGLLEVQRVAKPLGTQTASLCSFTATLVHTYYYLASSVALFQIEDSLGGLT
jgi:hypothetical protein